MDPIIEYLLITFAVAFAIFITVGQSILFYRRYLKSYKQEIEEYLKAQGLTLQSCDSPNEDNWKKSPFTKPSRSNFSLLLIHINGVPIVWKDQKYKVIISNEGKVIWLEIDTIYFKKPKLAFKYGAKRKSKQVEAKQQTENIRKVSDLCPACGFKLIESEYECPDCGLNFR